MKLYIDLSHMTISEITVTVSLQVYLIVSHTSVTFGELIYANK